MSGNEKHRRPPLFRIAAKVGLEASHSTVKGDPSSTQVKQAEANTDLSISNALADSLDGGKTLFLLNSIRGLVFKEKSESHLT